MEIAPISDRPTPKPSLIRGAIEEVKFAVGAVMELGLLAMTGVKLPDLLPRNIKSSLNNRDSTQVKGIHASITA